MKKRLSSFFQLLSEDRGVCIFAIILVPLCTFIFLQFGNLLGNFDPPTDEDYKRLHEQEEIVKEDFENLYSIKGASVETEDDEIKVILISDTSRNYELHMIFNKNKDFIKSIEVCSKIGFNGYSPFEVYTCYTICFFWYICRIIIFYMYSSDICSNLQKNNSEKVKVIL